MNAGCNVLISANFSIHFVRREKRESQLLHESNFQTKYLFGQGRLLPGSVPAAAGGGDS
jgi:hypothetical protein